MSQLLTNPSEATPAPAAAPPQKFWDKIITTTPVVLTVIATLLAGQSNSEMTRAQYSRSLASQDQSKVGDQWAYFQAKRTRTVILDRTGDLLDTMTLPGELDPAAFQALTQRLPVDLQNAGGESERLVAALGKAKSAVGADAAALQAAAQRLLASVRASAVGAADASKKANQTLAALASSGRLQAALHMLNSDDLPKVEDRRLSDPTIDAAQQAISSRKPDDEIARLVLEVKPQSLHQSLDAAGANGDAFDQASKPLDKTMQELSTVLAGQSKLVRQFALALHDLKLALSVSSLDQTQVPDAVRASVDRLDRLATGLKTSVDELSTSLRAGWNRFNARRYERDARYNQDAAFLYEIRVHQNSAHADRHLTRSHNFFYGMLAAQFAVTISTLALAMRQKSLLWGLASLAGLFAVLYGVTVYLDMVP